jgi:hypothetical protein
LSVSGRFKKTLNRIQTAIPLYFKPISAIGRNFLNGVRKIANDTKFLNFPRLAMIPLTASKSPISPPKTAFSHPSPAIPTHVRNFSYPPSLYTHYGLGGIKRIGYERS